jgi:NAD-dependent SIR2 family protein deacetylase
MLKQKLANDPLEKLSRELSHRKKIWILTGAGVSAPSGIPTYRDHLGNWQRSQPVQHDDFVNKESARKRYWARSMAGWRGIHSARPNDAHRAITKLQQHGIVRQVVTQNVDRLHSAAGTSQVLDLHGRLDRVKCLDCGVRFGRNGFQGELETANPTLAVIAQQILPDGDAQVDDNAVDKVNIPSCLTCGGVLMPDVVFFGGSVPRERVEFAFNALSESDCVLVIGSSLSVYSGFRFIKWAGENGLPLYAVNRGQLRGHDLFDQVVSWPVEHALPALAGSL